MDARDAEASIAIAVWHVGGGGHEPWWNGTWQMSGGLMCVSRSTPTSWPGEPATPKFAVLYGVDGPEAPLVKVGVSEQGPCKAGQPAVRAQAPIAAGPTAFSMYFEAGITAKTFSHGMSVEDDRVKVHDGLAVASGSLRLGFVDTFDTPGFHAIRIQSSTLAGVGEWSFRHVTDNQTYQNGGPRVAPWLSASFHYESRMRVEETAAFTLSIEGPARVKDELLLAAISIPVDPERLGVVVAPVHSTT